MCCHPIYSGRQVCERTSRGHAGARSHRIYHPPSFYGACLNFLARGIHPFLSLADREVKFLCSTYFRLLVVLHLLVTAPRFKLTSLRQMVSRLSTEPQGRPMVQPCFLLIFPPKPVQTQEHPVQVDASQCYKVPVTINAHTI